MSRNRNWWMVVLAMTGMLGCAHQPQSEGPARVEIQVTDSGFVPAVVTVPADQPVTLVVTRTSNATCATEFVMKSQNINQPLPLNQPVEIKLAAQSGGELDYACGMNMFKGKVKIKK